MPVAEHPFSGSWGYQVSGYYAPTARFGTPTTSGPWSTPCTERGIGVIVDWVPAHFPRDEFALARFDGTALYEHADPRQGHPSRLGHPGVQLRPQRGPELPGRQRPVLDGGVPHRRPAGRRRRLDALPRLLPQGGRVGAEPVRRAGEPGGRRLLEGGQRGGLRLPSRAPSPSPRSPPPGPACRGRPTSVASASASSGTWAGCTTRSTTSSHDPVYRRYHHDELTFGLVYAWNENFVLPALPRRGRARQGLAARQDARRPLAAARQPAGPVRLDVGPSRASSCCSWAASWARRPEWSHDRSLDWYLLHDPAHLGIQTLVRIAQRRLPGPSRPLAAGLLRRGLPLDRRQ